MLQVGSENIRLGYFNTSSIFFKLRRIPVVDLRGDDVSKETPPEDLLSFDGKADQAPLEYDIYDYLSLYDSQDVAQRRRRR